MGKRGKSQINRLPKAERTDPSSKIIILRPSSSTVQHSTVSDNQICTQIHNLSVSDSPTNASASTTPFAVLSPNHVKHLPYIVDEALSLILRSAGPPTMLTALSVNSQWRSVAKNVLAHVVHLDLGAIYKPPIGRSTPPTGSQVLNMLAKFLALRILTVRHWLYHDVFPDIAACISEYHSSTLCEMVFSEIYVTGDILVSILEHCPTLQILRVGGHDSLNNSVFKKLGIYCARLKGDQFRLQILHATQARCLSEYAFKAVINNRVASSIMITKCTGLVHVFFDARSSTINQPSEMNLINLSSCSNLAEFHFVKDIEAKSPLRLNLSQCTNLRELMFECASWQDTLNEAVELFQLRSLNLSGCRKLRSVVCPQPGSLPVFPHLEELILFGAHNLQAQHIENLFGLSTSLNILPKLRRLDLNGCALTEIMLLDYENLELVDCSGCPFLDSIVICGCRMLIRLSIQGRRMPLSSVVVRVPMSCTVLGKRKEWKTQVMGQDRVLTYQRT